MPAAGGIRHQNSPHPSLMVSQILNGGTSPELAAPVVAIPKLDAGFLKLLAGARKALCCASALPTSRASGPLLGVGAGHSGFPLLAAGAVHGWMAQSGGREAVVLYPGELLSTCTRPRQALPLPLPPPSPCRAVPGSCSTSPPAPPPGSPRAARHGRRPAAVGPQRQRRSRTPVAGRARSKPAD